MIVDNQKLRANVLDTAELLASDSSAGHVRPLVKTTLVEDVHARSDFIQYDKEFSFACDESDGRAGKGEAPSPLRYFLSSIAFCQQVWYAKGAALAGVDLEALHIDVHTYMDMRGEHKVGDAPPIPSGSWSSRTLRARRRARLCSRWSEKPTTVARSQPWCARPYPSTSRCITTEP